MTRVRPMLGCLVALAMFAAGGCGNSADLVPATEAEAQDGDSDANPDALAVGPGPAAVPAELDADGPPYLRSEAKRRLRTAKRSLLGDGTGRFVRATRTGDAERRVSKTVIRMAGGYDLPRLRSRSTLRVFDGSGDSVRFRIRTQRRRAFIRAAPWRCWLTMTLADFERSSGVGLPPGSIAFPPEVLGLLAARPGTVRGTDKVVATVPLAIASSLFGSVVERKLRGRSAGVRVPVLIRMRSKRFVSWSMHGVDLLAALEDSSIRLGRRMRKVLPYVNVQVRLLAPGQRVRVPTPPAGQRARPHEFDARNCGPTTVV